MPGDCGRSWLDSRARRSLSGFLWFAISLFPSRTVAPVTKDASDAGTLVKSPALFAHRFDLDRHRVFEPVRARLVCCSADSGPRTALARTRDGD
jgi:hypothetical protein